MSLYLLLGGIKDGSPNPYPTGNIRIERFQLGEAFVEGETVLRELIDQALAAGGPFLCPNTDLLDEAPGWSQAMVLTHLSRRLRLDIGVKSTPDGHLPSIDAGDQVLVFRPTWEDLRPLDREELQQLFAREAPTRWDVHLFTKVG